MFTLHPQLERDTFFVADLTLCRALLMNNCNFPWLILVPRIADAAEIIDLSRENRLRLMEEISHASTALKTLCNPDKLNVAALGNQVSQLHVHVIARTRTDSAWPNPVWGREGKPYADPQPFVERLNKWLTAP